MYEVNIFLIILSGSQISPWVSSKGQAETWNPPLWLVSWLQSSSPIGWNTLFFVSNVSYILKVRDVSLRFQKYYMESNTIQLLNFVEGNKIVMFWRSLLLLVEFELWYYFAEWVIQLLTKILEYPWLLLSNVQYKAWYNEFL